MLPQKILEPRSSENAISYILASNSVMTQMKFYKENLASGQQNLPGCWLLLKPLLRWLRINLDSFFSFFFFVIIIYFFFFFYFMLYYLQ